MVERRRQKENAKQKASFPGSKTQKEGSVCCDKILSVDYGAERKNSDTSDQDEDTIHANSDESVFECYGCDRTFSDEYEKNIHGIFVCPVRNSSGKPDRKKRKSVRKKVKASD